MAHQHKERTPEENEQLEQLLEAFEAMQKEHRAKFLRLFERIAKMPEGFPITEEIARTMLENDTDIPLN